MPFFFLCNPRALFLTQNAKIGKVFLVSYTVLARHFWHKPKIKVLFKYALKHHYETPTFLGCILFLRVLKAALWTQSRPFLRSPHQFNCRPRARVLLFNLFFVIILLILFYSLIFRFACSVMYSGCILATPLTASPLNLWLLISF